MTQTITPAAELQAKIEARRYDFFTLPTLDVTVKYRRPDLLKLSFNNSLPAAIADMVIKGYREAIEGTDAEAYKAKMAKEKIETDDTLIKSLGEKGYSLMSDLVVSHKILNVPESDFAAEPVPLISWNDVPENDAIAFLFNLINAAQTVTTATGGEVSAVEITNFPDGEQVPKRDPIGKSRKAVR